LFEDDRPKREAPPFLFFVSAVCLGGNWKPREKETETETEDEHWGEIAHPEMGDRIPGCFHGRDLRMRRELANMRHVLWHDSEPRKRKMTMKKFWVFFWFHEIEGCCGGCEEIRLLEDGFRTMILGLVF